MAYGFVVNTEGVSFTSSTNQVHQLNKGDFVAFKGEDEQGVGMVIFNANNPAEVKTIIVPWNMDIEYKSRAWTTSQAITILETKEDFDIAVSKAQTEAEAQAATEKAIEIAQKVEEEAKNEEAKKKRSKVICIATGLGLFALALWVINSKK